MWGVPGPADGPTASPSFVQATAMPLEPPDSVVLNGFHLHHVIRLNM